MHDLNDKSKRKHKNPSYHFCLHDKISIKINLIRKENVLDKIKVKTILSRVFWFISGIVISDITAFQAHSVSCVYIQTELILR